MRSLHVVHRCTPLPRKGSTMSMNACTNPHAAEAQGTSPAHLPTTSSVRACNAPERGMSVRYADSGCSVGGGARDLCSSNVCVQRTACAWEHEPLRFGMALRVSMHTACMPGETHLRNLLHHRPLSCAVPFAPTAGKSSSESPAKF